MELLDATVTPENADNKAVSWSSSSESVATVNENGLVVAVESGTATITVSTEDGGFTANGTVTVREVDPVLSYVKPYYTINTGNNGLVDNDVNSVFTDSSGTLYAGTSGGISIFDGSSWTSYTESDGLIGDHVNDIFVDSSGVIYAGTTSGLSIYDGVSWKNYTTSNGLSSNVVQSVFVHSSGDVYVGTNDGVCLYDGAWTVYNTGTSGIASDSVKSVYVDSAGVLFAGTFDAGNLLHIH